MKKRNIFITALMVAFLFYACQPEPEPQPEPDPNMINPEVANRANSNNSVWDINLWKDSTGGSHQDTLKIKCEECPLMSDTISVMLVSGSISKKDTTFIPNVILKK